MILNPCSNQWRIPPPLGESDSPLARVRTGTLACLRMPVRLISERSGGCRRRTDTGSVPSATSAGVRFKDWVRVPDDMAKAKTGSFYLTETVQLAITAGTGDRVQGTLDLGSYINVASGQAIAIDEVDFIWQVGDDYSEHPPDMVTADTTLAAQVTDLNPGTEFVRGDDASLVASGALIIDYSNCVTSDHSDVYPDNFGPSGLSDMFLVVNDNLYLTAGLNGGNIANSIVYCTARIRCRIVKLGTKDWMAIAIQSTASDN